MSRRPDPAVTVPLWESIAEFLRAAILSGELEPGSKLIETELAERFGTSRGPIREAIRELAREGLVTELPRRGTLVSTLTAHDLSEVYAVRQALEVVNYNGWMTIESNGSISFEERNRRLDQIIAGV